MDASLTAILNDCFSIESQMRSNEGAVGVVQLLVKTTTLPAPKNCPPVTASGD